MRQALLVHDNPDSFDSEDLVTGLARIGIEAHDIPKLSSTPFATVSGNPHPQWGIGRQLLFGDNSPNRFSRIWGDCDHLVSPFILVHSTYRDRVREGRTLAEDLRNLVYRADAGRQGKGAGLFKVPVDGGPAIQLRFYETPGVSSDPRPPHEEETRQVVRQHLELLESTERQKKVTEQRLQTIVQQRDD